MWHKILDVSLKRLVEYSNSSSLLSWCETRKMAMKIQNWQFGRVGGQTKALRVQRKKKSRT